MSLETAGEREDIIPYYGHRTERLPPAQICAYTLSGYFEFVFALAMTRWRVAILSGTGHFIHALISSARTTHCTPFSFGS